MAKPNYAFAKRQRDLAKKQAKEEKKQRKTVPGDNPSEDGRPSVPGDDSAAEAAAPAPDA